MLNATFAAGGRSLRMQTVSTQQNGDLLVQVGRYVMGITAGSHSFDDPGKFVSVYARQPDGDLLLTVTCFNRDTPPPTVSHVPPPPGGSSCGTPEWHRV